MPRFSKKYQDFDIEIKSVLAYITANQATVGVTPEQVTAYTAVAAAWTPLFTAYSNANTRTEPDIAAIKANYPLARHATNDLQQQIKHDGSITLTEDARINLYIHLDKNTRTPATRPTEVPALLVLSSTRLVSKISATLPSTEEENHRGLPDGTVKIVRLVTVTDTPEPPSRDAYHEIDATGHTVSDNSMARGRCRQIRLGDHDVSKHAWRKRPGIGAADGVHRQLTELGDSTTSNPNNHR